MEASRVIQDDQAIRDRILAASLSRIRQYGFTKTTMAEIAADSGMSTANIYRYFENKQEIACVCVSNCIRERIRKVEEAAMDPGLDVRQRLRLFVLTLLEDCHNTYSRDVKLHELVLFITNEHPEIVHDKIAKLHSLLVRILESGNRAGEINVCDIDTTARAMYTSIAVFDNPLIMHFYPLEEFRKRAHEVVDLVFDGLVSRENGNHTQVRRPS